MKLQYLLPIVLLSALCHAQAPFTPNPEIVNYRFLMDSPSIKNLKMLSKITPDLIDDDATLPLGYNWTKDVRLMESIKRLALDTQRMDENGREMPVDVFQHVRNEVLFKSVARPN